MKKNLLIATTLLHAFGMQQVVAQGVNNLWLGGYASWAGTPYGGVDIEFQNGSREVDYGNRVIDYYRANANITGANGNLLLSSNGCFLGNSISDTLLNGSGLSPGFYTDLYPDGIFANQAVLLLPRPVQQFSEATNTYFLFHGTIDDGPNSAAGYLYLTTIDMAGDGGLGEAVSKNEIMITDALNVGKITAVRHANGRDWWVFCHKLNSNIYYRILVTPEGASVDGTQAIGIVRPADVGQVCFSPDGTKFAYYWGVDDLEIFDFDRCTGLFSDPVFIPIDDTNTNGGVAFSPNSRFLYASSVVDMYQYDTDAADIEASMVHLGTWDEFFSPFEPFATAFDLAQLAPDGKIYLSTGNSTFHLHVIHDPDQPGLACNFEQHGVELVRWFWNSLPNHPNYHLGPIDGSVCDSLGINVGVAEQRAQGELQVFPNPTTGNFQASYPAHSTVGVLTVLDAHGKVVYEHRIPQWSTVHAVQLAEQPAGMYHCRLQWGNEKLTTRIIMQE
ncbi:MAG: T9SS type A sorting domain-containing protein [Flavobacteriales bacterium]|nr:T9SS type A sorting domain-containing protein [Flavobacteriales bacterium]